MEQYQTNENVFSGYAKPTIWDATACKGGMMDVEVYLPRSF